MEIREFLDARGGSPFASWFDDLDAQAAAKVTVALTRMERGNLSNAKGVGEGFKSTGSTGGPATGCISGRTETR
jgi:putative component of toxin-antitoxin plasmid stabilization module